MSEANKDQTAETKIFHAPLLVRRAFGQGVHKLAHPSGFIEAGDTQAASAFLKDVKISDEPFDFGLPSGHHLHGLCFKDENPIDFFMSEDELNVVVALVVPPDCPIDPEDVKNLKTILLPVKAGEDNALKIDILVPADYVPETQERQHFEMPTDIEVPEQRAISQNEESLTSAPVQPAGHVESQSQHGRSNPQRQSSSDSWLDKLKIEARYHMTRPLSGSEITGISAVAAVVGTIAIDVVSSAPSAVSWVFDKALNVGAFGLDTIHEINSFDGNLPYSLRLILGGGSFVGTAVALNMRESRRNNRNGVQNITRDIQNNSKGEIVSRMTKSGVLGAIPGALLGFTGLPILTATFSGMMGGAAAGYVKNETGLISYLKPLPFFTWCIASVTSGAIIFGGGEMGYRIKEYYKTPAAPTSPSTPAPSAATPAPPAATPPASGTPAPAATPAAAAPATTPPAAAPPAAPAPSASGPTTSTPHNVFLRVATFERVTDVKAEEPLPLSDDEKEKNLKLILENLEKPALER